MPGSLLVTLIPIPPRRSRLGASIITRSPRSPGRLSLPKLPSTSSPRVTLSPGPDARFSLPKSEEAPLVILSPTSPRVTLIPIPPRVTLIPMPVARLPLAK